MSLERENIIVNVVLGIIALIVLILLILLIRYRFKYIHMVKNTNQVNRIPNPLYQVEEVSSPNYAVIETSV